MIGARRAALRLDATIDRAKLRRLETCFWEATPLDALATGPLPTRALTGSTLLDMSLLAIVLPAFDLTACTFPAAGLAWFVLAVGRFCGAAPASGTDSVNAISAVTRKEAIRFKIFPNATRRQKDFKTFCGHYDVGVYL